LLAVDVAEWFAVLSGDVNVLIVAEGTIHRPVVGDQLAAVRAWFGPMVDSGYLHSGYVDHAGERLWLVVSDDSLAERASG
jgi:hypothetical protein